jgi:Lrp/AsnC family transcriptional regulator for asnA, asnC and gidA
MDELDRQLIGVLQMDGRASNAKIAREVGVTEATVRRRLQRLLHEDVIKLTAVPNSERMGYGIMALIGVQTGPGRSDQIAEAIAQLAEAHYVAVTTGSYDVFVWAGFELIENLAEFLHNKLGAIAGVRHTETFVTLATKKRADGRVV